MARREAVNALSDQVLEAATVRIRDMLNAERATLYLYDEQSRTLQSKIAHTGGGEPLEIRMPVDKGIAGRVALTADTLNVPDAYKHPDFNPQFDEQTGYRTSTMLVMPIYDRRKRVFAVAQLLNKRDGEVFTKADENKFQEFAAPLGILLETCSSLAPKK